MRDYRVGNLTFAWSNVVWEKGQFFENNNVSTLISDGVVLQKSYVVI